MKDLEQKTATKINVPGVQDQSDIITITGTKEGIEKAEHEIRVISDEQVILKKKLFIYYTLACSQEETWFIISLRLTHSPIP